MNVLIRAFVKKTVIALTIQAVTVVDVMWDTVALHSVQVSVFSYLRWPFVGNRVCISNIADLCIVTSVIKISI